MNEEIQLKLQAWIDGELNVAEAKRMATLVVEDAEAGLLAAELREVKSALAGCDVVCTVPETREFYWSKIARQIESEAKRAEQPVRPSLASRWRQYLMPLAGLATLACVALFTLTPPRPATVASIDDEFTSSDGAMDATTFRDQSSGLTVVWLQDKDTSRPTGTGTDQAGNGTVTD